MKLFHLELDADPPISIDLHTRLTVIAADADLRERLVSALDRVLRGRASGLRGTLAGDAATADFVVESTSGPVLPGAPLILRAADVTAALVAHADDPAACERAEHRHTQALHDLERAEAIRAEHESVIEALRDRRVRAMQDLEQARPSDGSDREQCRKELRAFVEQCAHLSADQLGDAERIALLERGTLLAGDASRLGACPSATVRSLLEALDTLLQVPSFVPGGTPVPPAAPAAFRKLLGHLDAADQAPVEQPTTQVELAGVESELRDAQTQTEGLDRAVASARSRALAVFAELEALRRAGQHADDAPLSYAAALRARLGRRIPTAWIGAPPIVLDDALAECPRDDLDNARTEIIEASTRAQLVFVTSETNAIAWAALLPADVGALVQPAPAVAASHSPA
jgi:hypothetical protein